MYIYIKNLRLKGHYSELGITLRVSVLNHITFLVWNSKIV